MPEGLGSLTVNRKMLPAWPRVMAEVTEQGRKSGGQSERTDYRDVGECESHR